MIDLDVNASVQNAYAVNLAANENRSFTMVQWDENGKLVYRQPFTPRVQSPADMNLRFAQCKGY